MEIAVPGTPAPRRSRRRDTPGTTRRPIPPKLLAARVSGLTARARLPPGALVVYGNHNI